ncbi:FecR family protein [Dyadobacter bucti]|uniref:FecR family protein n=1 Tax=Dyadobacter bucti TaxID=2572203 RepID=UPI0011097C5D|nr:FecR family protein [Dyadobacter bucti]
MGTERLALLLEKFRDGICTSEELEELDAWFDRFADREDELKNLLANDPEERRRLKTDITSGIKEHIVHFGENGNAGDRRIRKRIWWQAAAVFLLLLLAGGIWWKRSDTVIPAYATTKTAQKQLSRVVLPDSSVVWLKEDSELKYQKKSDGQTRDVFLSGEAFFSVTRNEEKPFIVHTSDLTIKVLGTSFNVRSYRNDQTVETTLVHGKVAIKKNKDRKDEPEYVVLSPNQRATYSKKFKTMDINRLVDAREIAVLNMPERESVSMVFDELPFTEVLSRLENRFSINIHIENRKKLTCTFTADFEKESLPEILDLIAASHRITYTVKGDDVFIRGDVCAKSL